MNKFTGVLLLGTALLAGCVDREGYYNSVREEDSHGLTSLRGNLNYVTTMIGQDGRECTALQPYTRCMPPRIMN